MSAILDQPLDLQQAGALKALLLQLHHAARGNPYAKYRDAPERYVAEVLGLQWTPKQIEMARSIVDNKRTMVRASHSVGKTHGAGGVVNWWYDSAIPSICLTTAPTDRQVSDLLWKEVRTQRGNRPGLMPKAARMESSPDHYAVGFTARDVNAFQGTHEEQLLIIFDEAVGVGAEYWEGADAMLTSGAGNRFLAIYNPTDTSSAAFDAELSQDANVIVISALEHPNIVAQLRGEPRPFPKAIDISWVEERIRGERPWCDPIDAADATPEDIEWPPESGQWYRPGPLMEARVLGRWPRQAVGSVWSEAAFRAAEEAQLPEPTDIPCEVGCDVARFGDDDTVMHVRRGPVSLHHEAHNGWDTARTAGRLKELAREYGQHCGIDGRAIQVKVDDDGVGGGVVDQRDGYVFEPVGAGTVAVDAEMYPNRRSELWFSVAGRAMQRQLDLSRLPVAVRNELRRQCMAPRWKVDSAGRRVVEPKAETKKRIHRSPDDADAMNLAYAFVPPTAGGTIVPQSIMGTYGNARNRVSRLGMPR